MKFSHIIQQHFADRGWVPMLPLLEGLVDSLDEAGREAVITSLEAFDDRDTVVALVVDATKDCNDPTPAA